MEIPHLTCRRRLSQLPNNPLNKISVVVESKIRQSLLTNQTLSLHNRTRVLRVQLLFTKTLYLDLITQTMQHWKILSPKKMIFMNQIPNMTPYRTQSGFLMNNLCSLMLVEKLGHRLISMISVFFNSDLV
jgi:hypothetical protein